MRAMRHGVIRRVVLGRADRRRSRLAALGLGMVCAGLTIAAAGAETSAAAPPSAVTSGTGIGSCAAISNGRLVVDRELGLSMVLPAEWRRLRAGDPGWVTIYGDHGSATETRVQTGDIPLFAAPVAPRDVDASLNLAIYVAAVAPGATVEGLAASYLATLAPDHH